MEAHLIILFAQFIQTVLPIILFTILFLIILKKLISTFRKGTTDPINFNSVSRLLSLGFTFLILSAKVNDLFHYIFNLIVSFFNYFSCLLKAWDGGNIANCNISFDNVPFLFTNLIIVFVVWLFICIFLILFFQNATSTSSQNFFSGNLFAKNTFVVFLLVFSIYLCVASIVAIPEFQALESSEFHNEELTEFAKEVEQQTGYIKEDLIIKEISPTDLKLKKSIDIYNYLNFWIISYNQTINMLWKDHEMRKNNVLDEYKSAILERTAPRERIKYRSILKKWLQDRSVVFTTTLYEKPKFDAIVRYVINDVSKVENDSLFRINKARVDSLYKETSSYIDVWENYQSTLEAMVFSSKYLNQGIPNKPKIGEQYGVFKFMSGWLLRTESMSLALIVGLFAFGLLGSIGSTFIRYRIKTGIDSDIKDFIPNLPAALINGISSAIVVFLAVKGSLIIFSGNDSGVNPYILFFTCFVAAVYSEDVWKWAQEKLAEQYRKKHDSEQQGENATNQNSKSPPQGGNDLLKDKKD